MPPDFIEFAAPVVAIMTMAAFGYASLRLWLKTGTERRKIAAGSPDKESSEMLDDLRQEMRSLYAQQAGQIEELHERIDFAERLLAQRAPQQLEGVKRQRDK